MSNEEPTMSVKETSSTNDTLPNEKGTMNNGDTIDETIGDPESLNLMNTLLLNGPGTVENKGLVSDWYNSNNLQKLLDIARPGDLFEVDRLTYKHWAVCADVQSVNGQRKEADVVHFDTPPDSGSDALDSSFWRLFYKKSTATIIRKKLVDVVGTSNVRINNGRDSSIWLKTAENIAIMNQRVQQFTEEHNRYHVANWNCEHFATYCRYGVKISDQSRIVWVILLIFCLDAVLGYYDWSSAFSKIILQHLASTYSELAVSFPFVSIGMAFIFILNYVISMYGRKRECYMVVVIIIAFLFGQNAWTRDIKLGNGASLYGLGIGFCVFFVICVIRFRFPERMRDDLGCVVFISYWAHVFGLTFTASLVAIIYVYDTVRLKHVDAKDMLNCWDVLTLRRNTEAVDKFSSMWKVLAFITVLIYLSYVFGLIFTVLLVPVIYVDDTIRLKYATHKEVLNCVAIIVGVCYLVGVFGLVLGIILAVPYFVVYCMYLYGCSYWNFMLRYVKVQHLYALISLMTW